MAKLKPSKLYYYQMFGHLLDYRFRPSQMARFVLPNVNTTHPTRSYTESYPLYNEDEY